MHILTIQHSHRNLRNLVLAQLPAPWPSGTSIRFGSLWISKVLAPHLRRYRPNRHQRPLLQLCRLHGNRNTHSENSNEGEDRVPTPVLGVAPPSSRGTPHLRRVAGVMAIGGSPAHRCCCCCCCCKGLTNKWRAVRESDVSTC